MKFKLAENMRAILEKWRTHESSHIRNMATTILMTADGKTPDEISSELGLTARTVNKWLTGWEKEGLKIFADGKRRTTENVAIVNGLVVNVPALSIFKHEPLPITLEDTMAEAGHKILQHQFNAMRYYESIARTGEHTEGVHKMRVATRRLRSAHRIFKPYVKYASISKPLRQTAQVLGAVRDMDVFLIKTQQYIETNLENDETPLLPLLDTLREDYNEARDNLNQWLDSKAYTKFVQHFQSILEQPTSSKTDFQVKYTLPELVFARLGAVRRYESQLASADSDVLHKLRVEFKRLRYLLEFFENVLDADDLIQEVKNVQDLLGDLNDAQVAQNIIARLYKRIPKKDREGVKAYREARHEEMVELIERFPTAWEKFNKPDLRQKLAVTIAAL